MYVCQYTSMEQFINTLQNNVQNSMQRFRQIQQKASCTDEPIVSTKAIVHVMKQYIEMLERYNNTAFIYVANGVNPFKRSSIKLVANEKEQHKEQPSQECVLHSIDSVDLKGNALRIPLVSRLEDMTPMFCWFKGDATHKKGVYVCICKGFYIRVSLANVVHGTDKDSKANTIRCRYITRSLCDSHKHKSLQGRNDKKCKYVHKGERFNKVGSIYRCSVEGFGNQNTLNDDLRMVSTFDIKHMLMYSLGDDLLSLLWYQNTFRDSSHLVFTNIDTL